jgi:hypothetical protein
MRLHIWCVRFGGYTERSSHPRPLAPLTLHHLVPLLHQPLPLAILALLLLLDVGAFFIGHDLSSCFGAGAEVARRSKFHSAAMIG